MGYSSTAVFDIRDVQDAAVVQRDPGRSVLDVKRDHED